MPRGPDPDQNPDFERFPAGADPRGPWKGITQGIAALRNVLASSTFTRTNGDLPITWLLRADRQITELYGKPDFCYTEFEEIWKRELGKDSELGWHPHLYRWGGSSWDSYLGQDDDLDMLESCLQSLRFHAAITSVRTGWDYHSNRLMKFFSDQGFAVDASAIPGSIQKGRWSHNWAGCPRTPYRPDPADYRRPGQGLDLWEVPVLARRLNRITQAARWGLRAFRGNGLNWVSAGWQGVMITYAENIYLDALKQALGTGTPTENLFMATYFHTDELLAEIHLDRFVRNLEITAALTVAQGYDLKVTTLSRLPEALAL